MNRLAVFSIGVVFFFGILTLSGCGSQEVTQSPEAVSDEGKVTQVEPEARNMYAQAEKAFDQKNFDQATRLFSQIKVRFPNGKARVYSAYRLGIIHYYKENYPAAAREFEYFVAKMPNSELTFDATYNWAACEHQMGRNDRAYQVLSKLKLADVQGQGPKRAETVYALTARVAAAMNNHPSALAALALQLQLPLEESARAQAESKVDEQVALMNNQQRLQSLREEVSEPTVRRKIEDRLAQLNAPETAPEEGSPAPAAIAAIPSPSTVIPATPAITLPSGGSRGSSQSVGVILPLTGKWANYGKRALDGILLASRVYGDGRDNFRIHIKDSQSNPTVAAAAVEELHSRYGVMAVIGPLASKEAVAVGDKAQALGIPNVSLSTKEGVSEKSPYLFQTGLTPAVQLENLVRYAVQGKGLKRFAILAPNNPFGRDMAQSFWDYVTANGAVVSSYQLYAPEDQDFQDSIRGMVGLQDLKFRRLEVGKLQEYLREVKAKTGKEPKSQLQPIVDFDAIFVPDSPKAVAQVAASLNYYDVSSIPLLGTAEWNSDQFFRRGASLIQSAIFPAGFYMGSAQSTTKEFIQGFQGAFGQSPDLLAAQAYEAMQLVAFAMRSAGSEDRNQLANALASIRDFDSPMGKLSFDTQRIGRRRLAVLSLEGGNSLSEH